jgi:multidrug efflux pump subunit AcrA (membrane-fusion protein)
MTGAFANVRLELPNPEAAIHVPASALIFDQKSLRVATVNGEDRIVLKQVTISRDLGREVEIGPGLTAEDRIVESPPDGIAEGDRVRVAGKPGPGNAAANAPKPQRKL